MKKRTTTAIMNTRTREGTPANTRKPRQAEADVTEGSITGAHNPLPHDFPELGGLLPPLVAFLSAQNMCVQIVDPNSEDKYDTPAKLPHIIAAALPGNPVVWTTPLAWYTDKVTLPVRTIWCTVVPEITGENLKDVMCTALWARLYAHAGYVAAAHISPDPAVREELAATSESYKIGIIQIGQGAEKTRIMHQAQWVVEPEFSLGITLPRLAE